jgi:hypothetical protein
MPECPSTANPKEWAASPGELGRRRKGALIGHHHILYRRSNDNRLGTLFVDVGDDPLL